MRRAICCVATTPRYQKGMKRLANAVIEEVFAKRDIWRAWNVEPEGCPTHAQIPYAFKAYALKDVAHDADLLLWADASILPIRSLEPLWERIERDGYWFANNGWRNDQWTADSAYPDLFPDDTYDVARAVNSHIPHVVATSFGLNVKSEIGREFLNEYYRLASTTKAFCGPWWNSNGEREDYRKFAGAAPCGPPSCLGHRHDQCAASVIAWRLGMKLTESPSIFTYRGQETDDTILVAEGAF